MDGPRFLTRPVSLRGRCAAARALIKVKAVKLSVEYSFSHIDGRIVVFRSEKRNWIAATGLAPLPAAVWGQACPVVGWEYASGDDQHYEVFETDQDARQIYRTR